MSDPQERRELRSAIPEAIVLGDKVFAPAYPSNGRPFVFTRDQGSFLAALDKMKSIEAAAISVGKSVEWAQAFLRSKKLQSFVAGKMQEQADRSGMTIAWWYQFGKWLAAGERISFRGACPFCDSFNLFSEYEAESALTDEMAYEAACKTCYKPIVLERTIEPFKPSREQVEGWKELGSRLIPKVERVHHEFSTEEIVFEAG